MNNTNNPNSEATVIDGKKLSIEEYLDQDEKKDLLRFLTAGSVDDGKSTLIGIFSPYRLVLRQQTESEYQQVIKVHSISLQESLLIYAIYFCCLRYLRTSITLGNIVVGSISLRSHKFVFSQRNMLMHGSWLI